MIRPHILLVEDDPTTVQLTQFMLHQAGYICKVANNGYDALELVQIYKFDLVLLDLNMPMMNGFTFMERLNQTDLKGKVPVIVITIRDDKSTILKAKKLGVSDFVIKPLERDSLLGKIETSLGHRPQGYEVFLRPNDERASVHFSLKGRIKSISETGMVFQSPVPLRPDSGLENFVSPIFETLKIKKPKLHICDHEEIKGGYEVYISFMDLREPDIEILREWVVRESFKNLNQVS